MTEDCYTGDAKIDPVTLSVIRGQFKQLVNEMDSTLVGSAFSPIICEAMDMACGLYRPDGRTISQGDNGMPIFAGNMRFTVATVADAFEGDLAPGDVFMVNDPYTTGTHMNDVKLVKPVFPRDELVVFLANTGHWIDVGSASPGGMTGKTRQFYQEGIRLPPLRIFEAGERNDDVLEFVFSNVRSTDSIQGDFAAQLNALQAGEDRFESLVEEHGIDTLSDAIAALERSSEDKMRAQLDDVPDGTYEFTDYLDNDGITDEPLAINLELTVTGTDVELDFEGTATLCQGPVNTPRPATVSMCNLAFKHVFPDIPINAGCFEPLEYLIPEGSLLDAQPPSATAGYSVPCQRVVDVVMSALAQALPEDVPAQSFSTSGATSVGGTAGGGSEFVTMVFVGGGYGGSAAQDGLTHCTPPFARAKDPDVEVMETRFPLTFHERGLRADSAGAGRHRGGFGTVYDLELESGTATVSCVADRGKFTPRGLSGGGDATGMTFRFTIDGEAYVPELGTKDQDIQLSAGDRLRLESPGGGGFGDPFERDKAVVLADVENGMVSPETAAETYGVAIVENDGDYRVDDARTAALRSPDGDQ